MQMKHSKMTEDVLHFQLPSKLLVIQKVDRNKAPETLFDFFPITCSFYPKKYRTWIHTMAISPTCLDCYLVCLKVLFR